MSFDSQDEFVALLGYVHYVMLPSLSFSPDELTETQQDQQRKAMLLTAIVRLNAEIGRGDRRCTSLEQREIS